MSHHITTEHQAHPVELSSRLAPLHEPDIARMREYFDNLLAMQPDSMQRYGRLLFERIAVPNWSVEWNLARWLGARSGLTATQQERLVAVNVLGLGYVRLHDDLRDGESSMENGFSAGALEKELFQAAVGELRNLVGEIPSFWTTFETVMARWDKASKSSELTLNVLRITRPQLDRLADIGAPLLITCAACNALCPESPENEVFSKPVRHYLTAAVLYDHMKDWNEDLVAGRANLFVQAMLALQPETLDQGVISHRMQHALIQTSDFQAYSALVIRELLLGADASQVVGLDAFAQHLRALASEVHESEEQMLNGIQKFLMRGRELLFSA